MPRMLQPVALMLVLVARTAAQGTLPHGAVDDKCETAYQDAYLSALSGPCSSIGCSTECQNKISAVLGACKGLHYNQTDSITGRWAERNFLQKAMRALRALGPLDCFYDIAVPNCDSTCTMFNVTAGAGISSFEQDHCISVDPGSDQSTPAAVWSNCEGKCRAQFETLNHQCSGCSTPDLANFLSDAGRKLSRCGIGNGKSCAALGSVLNTACCAGPDGKPGNGDDTCNIGNGTMPPDCTISPVCMGAVQVGAATCPHNFTEHPVLTGLFQDCGGKLAQLFAAEAVETVVPIYCDSTNPALTPGGRRLTSDVEQQVAGLFEMYAKADDEHNPVIVDDFARRRSQDSQPKSPACQSAYETVFNSALFGLCSGYNESETHSPFNPACKQGCQKQITDMLVACKNDTETEVIDNVEVTHSFAQKAANALQQLGTAPQCNYHLGTPACDFNACNLDDIQRGLEDAGCTSPFLFFNFNNWLGCEDADGKPQAKPFEKQCWEKFLSSAQNCSDCQDDQIPLLLAKTARKNADKPCEEVDDQGYCKQPQDISKKIRDLCCAGADGKVGTADDPCSKHTSTNAHSNKDVTWYIPDACQANKICSAYIVAAGDNMCPSTFIDDTKARQMYSDCGGDVDKLIRSGLPCEPEAFYKALQDNKAVQDNGHTPTADNPGIPNAAWGSCYNNKTAHGPYLKSGQTCAMTCKTGFCVSGAQPHCLHGVVSMFESGHSGFFDFKEPMHCDIQKVATCDIPPNGGCDPLVSCVEDDIKLMGSQSIHTVTCGPCPSGYWGTGEEGCQDINECEMRPNGGCDINTKCNNTDGGYQCSPCPAGLTGNDGRSDPMRESGCCPPDKTYVPVGTTGAECRSCPDGQHVDLKQEGKCVGRNTFQDLLTMGTGHSSTGFLTVFILMLLVGGVVAGICHLCGKKSYKDEGGRFEKIDVGSIGTGPSIYDTTWAR